MNLCRVDFFHVNASFSWFSHIPIGKFFLNFVQLLTMIMGKTYLNFKRILQISFSVIKILKYLENVFVNFL